MTTIKTFADELAALEIPGVTRRFPGLPKVLYPADLPAMWVEMPSAVIDPSSGVDHYSTFAASAARYTAFMFIAVDVLDESYPDYQRDAVLDIAAEVELWAKRTEKTLEMVTQPNLKVAGREYRGVTVRVTAPDME